MVPQSWLTQVDAYCERLDASFWAEPLNAVSNAAFFAAAFAGWRAADRTDWPARGLSLIIVAIGIGSFLFHTYANRLTALLDVAPIVAFILCYLVLAVRRYLGYGALAALAAMLALIVTGVVATPALRPALGTTAGYAAPFLALLAFGFLLLTRGGRRLAVSSNAKNRAFSGEAPARLHSLAIRDLRAARALILATALFGASMVARMLDAPLCAWLPFGTHFLWHILNATTLWVLVVAAARIGPAPGARDFISAT